MAETTTTARLNELAAEVARLTAEVDTLRGVLSGSRCPDCGWRYGDDDEPRYDCPFCPPIRALLA
jgi:hypothetical protein